MTRKSSQRRKPRVRKVSTPCPFCSLDKNPDFKDYKVLAGYLSDREKILGRDRTGVCSRHQRRLAQAIKRARFLGLLPFSTSTQTG